MPSEPHQLVVAIFADPGAADELLAALGERGGLGATVLDGRGLSEHLAAHVSLFAGFKAGFAAVGHSRVVLSVIPTAQVGDVLGLIRTCGKLDQPGTVLAFALDLAAVVGLQRNG
jgi:hypothetical protein